MVRKNWAGQGVKISFISAVFNFRKAVCFLMIIGVLAVFVLSIGEVFALMSGNLVSQNIVLTSYWIKSIKDIVFVLLLLVGLLGQVIFDKRHSKHLIFIYFTLIAFLLFSMILSERNQALVLLAGLRWFIPFLLPFFIYHFIDKNTINTVTKPLQAVFIVHFLLQIIQLNIAYEWYGLNRFGLSARSPGIFLIPATSAAFTVMVFYLSRYFNNSGLLPNLAITWISFISVALTESATGLIAFFILLTLLHLKKAWLWLAPILVATITPVIVYAYLNMNARGEEMMSVSGGTRIDIFLDAFSNAGLFSSKFGQGTNTAVLITGDGMIADSTYTAILVNFGISGLTFFLAILAISFIYAMLHKSKSLAAFIILMSVFSLTLNISETYPVSLLAVLVISFFIHQSKASWPSPRQIV